MKKHDRLRDQRSAQVLQAGWTGEIIQPVRLYYFVSDGKVLLDALRRLKCIDYDNRTDSWQWLYMAEARGLTFDKP